MATNDNKKKPLVTLDAANPVPSYQDYAAPSSQVGAGWAGNDNTPSFTYEQVQQMQNYPGHLSEANKVEAKPSEAPKATEVWENTPEAISYDKMFEEFKRLHPTETDEEKRERLKRQRRNHLFAAIGDGISALSNLYFTTKGSPSADQSKSMSKALRDRYDKEDKARENDEKSNLTTLLSIMNQKRLAHASWLNKKNQEELVELRRKAYEAGNQAALKRVEELMRHNTALEQIERENKEADQQRKDKEAAQKQKESEERIADKKKRTQIYGSGVASQTASRSAANAERQRHNRQTEAQGWARVNKSGGRGGGAPHYNTSESVVWYDDQGQKHTRTVKSNTSTGKQGQAKPKKKLRKNNMGL